MATWLDTSVLDVALDEIRQNAIRIHLIDAYTAGDNFTTVNGNTIGIATITTANFDATLTPSGDDRAMDFNGASGTASQTVGAGQPLHLALTDNSGIVFAVTNETSDQAISSGNPITFPSWTITAKQPTQV